MSNSCPVCGNAVNIDDSVCQSCGFRLMGSTQQFKPISVQDLNIDKPSNVVSTLRVIRGPQIGTIFTLGDGEMSVGRNPHCDIFLNDMTVSRAHASIQPVNGTYHIVDENSFNGVWVNDQAVGRAVMHQGDIVQIGVFCLVFEQKNDGK